MKSSLQVRVLQQAQDAVALLLEELHVACAAERALVSFATGGTFTALLQALAREVLQGRIDTQQFVATHLDEYLGFAPDTAGGMVHELTHACPPLQNMLRAGTFLPVPHDGNSTSLANHEAALARAGGVRLQFLGIGRNGHLAFNEPGTPQDSGFHCTKLAELTRDDARARFAPHEVPREAATAGLASILAAQRIVLCAFGKAKAAAVRAMLQGPVDVACPASALQRHRNALVLLDLQAASELSPAVAAT